MMLYLVIFQLFYIFLSFTYIFCQILVTQVTGRWDNPEKINKFQYFLKKIIIRSHFKFVAENGFKLFFLDLLKKFLFTL